MPKRSSIAKSARSKPTKKPRERDAHEAAFDAIQQIIRETEGTGKDPLAVALGRRGGLKGGKARAAKLSDEQRADIARRAATARWAKVRSE